MKKQLLLLVASAFLLAGCQNPSPASTEPASEPTSESASQSSVLTSTESVVSSTEETVDVASDNNYDSDVSEDVSSDGGQNEFDSGSSAVSESSSLSLDGLKAFQGSAIKDPGTYYLKGEYGAISITAAKGSELTVIMDGATISSNEGTAFGSSKNITLHLILVDGSVNSIVNDFADTNAFYVKGNVDLTGKGTLNVESKQKNGFKVSKNLVIGDGVNLSVKGYNHAITAQSLTANGASISVTSQTKDGVQCECDADTTEFTKEEGFAHLTDVDFTADTYGDGIQADTFVYISGGTYNITTHGEFVSYSTENMETYGLKTDDFKFVKSGNTYKRVAKDEIRNLNSSYYALKNSVKGIKAGCIEYDSDGDDVDDVEVATGDYQVYIAHLANITIDSTDDCIHTNYGNTTIDSANLTLSTFDDGIHADYDLKINNASISILSSYEGLEGGNVTISGEATNIIANSSDDGINAASDVVNENNIIINDGYIRVYAGGDGVDANTGLYLNGGTVIVEGPGTMNGSLDAEQIYFNGGIVFACSTSGMRERMTATQYTFAWQGSTIASGTKVSVIDADNNALFSYTFKQSNNQIIFSHPDMVNGATYRILSGSTVLASITMTSTLVTSGTQGGGGFPGGPGGPGSKGLR